MNKLTAIIYARVSPRPGTKLEEDPQSIPTQIERCKQYCKLQGIPLSEVQVITDPLVSASKVGLAKRPGGAEMVKLLKNGQCKIVIAARLDRLFRDEIDGLTWLDRWTKKAIRTHFADEGGVTLDCSTAKGKLVAAMLLAVTSYEPRVTRERTSVAMKRHIKEGYNMGSKTPYGYELDPENKGRLRKSAAEQRSIEAMVLMHGKGMNISAIARTLTNDPSHKPRGQEFSRRLVRDCLKRNKETQESNGNLGS